jgi:hypothetical protein
MSTVPELANGKLIDLLPNVPVFNSVMKPDCFMDYIELRERIDDIAATSRDQANYISNSMPMIMSMYELKLVNCFIEYYKTYLAQKDKDGSSDNSSDDDANEYLDSESEEDKDSSSDNSSDNDANEDLDSESEEDKDSSSDNSSDDDANEDLDSDSEEDKDSSSDNSSDDDNLSLRYVENIEELDKEELIPLSPDDINTYVPFIVVNYYACMGPSPIYKIGNKYNNVSELKSELSIRIDKNVEDFYLIYQDKILDENCELSYYDIEYTDGIVKECSTVQIIYYSNYDEEEDEEVNQGYVRIPKHLRR